MTDFAVARGNDVVASAQTDRSPAISDANAKPPSKPGKLAAWSLANAGARQLNWLVHAPLILSGKDKGLREKVLNAIDANARWLDRNVGRSEDQLAQVAGWCAIVAVLRCDRVPVRGDPAFDVFGGHGSGEQVALEFVAPGSCGHEFTYS